MRVVVTTWHKYKWLMPTFLHFYNKNWPDNPYFTSFTRGADPWMDTTIDYIESLKDDKILILMDDYILTTPVGTTIIQGAEGVCEDDVGCVQLAPRPTKFSKYYFDSGISGFKEYPLTEPYSVSMQATIWQREFLLDIMQRGETAWQFEVEGSKRVHRYGKRVLCVDSTAMTYHPCGYMQKGKVVKSVKQWVGENW